MTRIVLKSKVGADGVLQLTVPVGPDDANREVRVVIESEPAAPVRTMSQEEWEAWVLSTAGKWQGDFELPSLGLPEERDRL